MTGNTRITRRRSKQTRTNLLAAVHVVAEEQVVGLWREAAVLEQSQQIVVLPVDVPCAYCELEDS